MELIRGRLNIDGRHRGCVATIGNFDGVHLGHRAVIAQLLRRSGELGLASMAMVFEPQPQEYFKGKAAPARLSPLRDKLVRLEELGVDYLLCLRFNRELAGTTAGDFIRSILVESLDVRHLVVGDDFRFGHGRKGDFGTLVEAGGRHGFSVEEAETREVRGARVSSTRIREALKADRFDEAEELLGRPFTVSGKVVHGDRRGRQWGFPTANIAMDRRRTPFTGIYAVEVTGIGQRPVNGVASIGVRPTVPGPEKALLEIYLLDFDADIYGRRIAVRFLHRIRDEERFDDYEALKARIAEDVRQAELFFRGRAERSGTA